MTSSSLKKARLEAERSKLVGRMTDCDKTDDALQEKNTKYDCIFKLIIMGDTGVGKTWLLSKIVEQEKDMQPTFIANFYTRRQQIDGYNIKLEIWDISGDHKFSHLGLMFYPGASAVILAYDMTRRDTLDTCMARDSLLKDMDVNGTEPAKFLVGCKSDLAAKREVEEMEAQALATEMGARWFEVSAVTEGKVEFLMNKILRDLLDRNMPELVSLENDGSEVITEPEDQEEVTVVVEEDKPLGLLKKLLKINF